MKKHLLLSSVLVASISTYAQNSKNMRSTTYLNVAKELACRFQISESNNAVSQPATLAKQNEENRPVDNNPGAKSVAAITVTKISGSMNVFGMLESSTKLLTWNDNVDAVTFIHRKSPTYVASPVSNSGSIVSLISSNMGTTWDSTCIWTNANAGRFPQGGIFLPPGNSGLSDSYIVGLGTTVNNVFTGGWCASKQVTLTPKNAPGPDQQFFSNASAVPPMGKIDYIRTGFDITNDGVVHGMGLEFTDINNSNASGLSGGYVVKGTFNPGTSDFSWSSTLLSPPVTSDSNGEKNLSATPYMAWNEAGTVGYAMFIGVRQGATGSNEGMQPIIYKTTDSGNSWTLLNGIDFNSPSMKFVTDRIYSITTSTLSIPAFDISEGIDITVDAYNNLHIGCLIAGTYSTHQDSITSIGISTVTKTKHQYANNEWPYIYDFMGDGNSPWKVFTIDSLPTEAPSGNSASSSFSANPITDVDPNSGNKQVSSTRLQLSRNITGDRIAFVWAEGDTNLTNSKFLQFPDLKARLACVANGTITLDATKTNFTSNLSSSLSINNKVKNKAYFHAVSPKMKEVGTALLQLPITVTNSSPLVSQGPNDHYYISGEITNFACTIGLDEQSAKTMDANSLIPNPAKGNVTARIQLSQPGTIDLAIYNTIGQEVRTIKANGNTGSNDISISLSNLSSGIYIVKTTAQGKTTSKKLIVE